MRQKLFIFTALMMMVVLLVGLNAVSYVGKEEKPDDEFHPNRSTYHAGATGTRAFYDLLAETGRKPVRWQESPSALLVNSKNKPQTFVVVGDVRREFVDEEIKQLLRWVSLGGKLVVIDRSPRQDLISTTANWRIFAAAPLFPPFGTDPSDGQQMTDKTVAGKPLQPTVFTRNINAVQPSRFASSIKLETRSFDETTQTNDVAPEGTPPEYQDDYRENGEPLPASETIALSAAPVVHLANDQKNLLADFPYGAGQIVFLSDPYIVSNAGISLVDNAQLAINVVASREGVIAFDEYHQGFGGNENHLLAYFSGTPVPAILAQIVLLVGAVLFTQSRRFARPLPVNEPDRLSKLEYVSAMAELQGRVKAYDLAIENIYTEFRRRVAKFFGADNFLASCQDLANLIAERAGLDARDIENLMRKCEDIVRGEPTNKREVLAITTRLREIEEKLGLKRTRKQAFKK